jgi:transposase
VLKVLEPFKADLKGVIVESTYNWYWLVDGLQEHGYTVHLANPSAIKQYEGIKHTDDKWDSFWLAHMKHLNILLPKEFVMLTTIPGIGIILGLTIMLEVGDMGRFSKVGNYSSYCRCVSSKRLSNGKKKGENNNKNGNKYLAWAYVESAHFATR